VTVDVDRLALSCELLTLGETYAIEATMWRDDECKAQLLRMARQFAEIGRQVIGTSDIAVADAYAREGHRVLGNVQGTRRLFKSLSTPPRVRRGGDACSPLT
jgi:hypothetical protein